MLASCTPTHAEDQKDATGKQRCQRCRNLPDAGSEASFSAISHLDWILSFWILGTSHVVHFATVHDSIMMSSYPHRVPINTEATPRCPLGLGETLPLSSGNDVKPRMGGAGRRNPSIISLPLVESAVHFRKLQDRTALTLARYIVLPQPKLIQPVHRLAAARAHRHKCGYSCSGIR